MMADHQDLYFLVGELRGEVSSLKDAVKKGFREQDHRIEKMDRIVVTLTTFHAQTKTVLRVTAVAGACVGFVASLAKVWVFKLLGWSA